VANFKLTIAPYTLYAFMAGGLISVLWCLVALGLVLARPTPRTSLFPEIDFASIIAASGYYVARHVGAGRLLRLLSLLNNMGSSEIRKALAPSMLFVTSEESRDDMNETAFRIELKNNGLRYSRGDFEGLSLERLNAEEV
jgi:hypothetical protein